MTNLEPMGTAGLVPAWTMTDRLRKARESAGFDQREFAERTGLSRNTISNYENGTTKPRKAGLNLWSLASGVPIAWIETGIAPAGGEPTRGDEDECTPSDLNREPTD